jgi:hypothetical protein
MVTSIQVYLLVVASTIGRWYYHASAQGQFKSTGWISQEIYNDTNCTPGKFLVETGQFVDTCYTKDTTSFKYQLVRSTLTILLRSREVVLKLGDSHRQL